jgi:hypothetical protein
MIAKYKSSSSRRKGCMSAATSRRQFRSMALAAIRDMSGGGNSWNRSSFANDIAALRGLL